MKTYTIASFYKFTPLKNIEELKPLLLSKMKTLFIKGTIILAEEGINATICGEDAEINTFIAYLEKDLYLAPMTFMKTFDDSIPFDKAKVKIRPEIVSLGIANVNPQEIKDTHVSPQKWNELINDPSVLVVDTRNEYEYLLGAFPKAINPNTINFRDFPQFVETRLLDKKKHKIAMYCTGGIRCEKTTAYLKQNGFDEVYQLQGGILNYLASTSQEQSLWEGSCFIFDDRLALDTELKKLPQGTIDKEWKHKHREQHLSEKSAL